MGRSIKIIFLIIEKLIVIAAAVSLILSFLSVYYSPEEYPWLFVFGYGMFFIYCLNFVIMLWLTIRLSFWAFVPFILLIITFQDFTTHYSFSIFKKYESNEKSIKIISYNVRGFRDNEWELTTDSLINFINSQKADIIALQECWGGDIPIDTLKERLTGMQYMFLFSADADSKYHNSAGIVIFSKFPLLKQHSIDFQNSANKAQYCDVIMDADTIRVFNMHLQTTGIDRDERVMLSKENITSKQEIDSTEREVLKTIYNKVAEANIMRAHQVDSLSPIISQSRHPIVVCGDFNDVPQSYTYRTIVSSGDLTDSFKKAGSGYGHSFNDFFNLLRIDYILYSDRYKALTYDSPDIKLSDHNPVIVTITKQE